METIDVLRGKTLTSVVYSKDELIFTTTEGGVYKLYHEQDCCESVNIESVVGKLDDLVGEPLLLVEEISGETSADFDVEQYESYTWTFYKFATRKGYVDVRWLGESNGYYSESVDFVRVK